MHSFTQRRQIRTGDERQIFTPEQLSPGIDIAIVTIIGGTRPSERVLRVAAELAGVYSREDKEKRVLAASKNWRFTDLEGLLPQWRGTIHECNERGVTVDLISRPKYPWQFKALLGVDPVSLPVIEKPARLYSSYEDMGLVPIQPIATRLRSEIYTEETGRWHSNATLNLTL